MVDSPDDRTPWWQTSGTTLAADGTPLAFARGGPAEPAALVCCNGVGVSTFFWDYVGKRFSRDYRVVVWDYRGHGASGVPPRTDHLSMANVADDLARVMDANEVSRAVLLGHSMGCQTILEFYRLFPDRVLGLVPILGSYGRPADTFLDPRVGPTAYRAAYEVATRVPGLINLGMRLTLKRSLAWQAARATGLVHPDLASKADLDNYMDHLARMSPRVFMDYVRAAQNHNAGPILGDIACPTLVVAGERDLFTPRHLSEEMAGRIPHAELLEIPRGSHAALIEQPDLINTRLERFMKEAVLPFARGEAWPRADEARNEAPEPDDDLPNRVSAVNSPVGEETAAGSNHPPPDIAATAACVETPA